MNHYHVKVQIDSRKATLVEHDHHHFGPPHSHRDTANVEITSASMTDRAQAEAALKDFRRKMQA